jgi:hypothetical protein
MSSSKTVSSSQRFGQGSLGRDSSTSSSGGWGKQAAKRFNTTEVFKKDPLLKSLEGKIAVGFGDYKPWQRTNLPRYVPPIRSVEGTKSKKLQSRPLSSRTTHSTYSVGGTSRGGPDNDRPQSATTLHTQCSSVCLHPWIKKPILTPINAYDKKTRKNISLLKVFHCLFLYFTMLLLVMTMEVVTRMMMMMMMIEQTSYDCEIPWHSHGMAWRKSEYMSMP